MRRHGQGGGDDTQREGRDGEAGQRGGGGGGGWRVAISSVGGGGGGDVAQRRGVSRRDDNDAIRSLQWKNIMVRVLSVHFRVLGTLSSATAAP